jgi:hypothetical protein
MSSGDSTSRAWWGDRSIQRTRPSAAAAPKRSASTASCPARSASFGKIRRQLADTIERLAGSVTCAAQALQGRCEIVAPGALFPAQLERAARLAQRPGGSDAQLACQPSRSRRASSCQGARPRACCRPTASMSRAVVEQPGGGQRGAEELHAGLRRAGAPRRTRPLRRWAAVRPRRCRADAMSAKNRWWLTTTRSAAMASRGPSSHGRLRKVRALAAQAVLARRGDQRDHAAALVQAIEFGQVAARRALRPLLRPWPACVQPSGRAGRSNGGPASCGAGTGSWLRPFSSAMLTGSCSASRSRGRSRRKSWSCRLFVAVLTSARRPDRASRHQVGEGLADTCARLGHQRVPACRWRRPPRWPCASAPRAPHSRVGGAPGPRCRERLQRIASSGTQGPPSETGGAASCRLGRVELGFEPGDHVLQRQAALLQAPQRQTRRWGRRAWPDRSGCPDRHARCAVRSAVEAGSAGCRPSDRAT